MAFSDAPQCTATAKSTQERCKNPAVEGRSVCRLHGGNAGRPIVHGRYSLKHKQSLADKHKQFLEDPAPWNLNSELALMRTLLQDYLERFEDYPLKGQEVDRIFAMLREISQLVERIAKILNNTALTQSELHLLQIRLGDLLEKYLDDPDDRVRFLDELAEAVGQRYRAGAREPNTRAGITVNGQAGPG